MNTTSIVGTAKRLALSLVAVAALGGCAVYEPSYAGAYSPYSGYEPYAQPAYVAPPLYFNFGYQSRRGFHDHWRGFYGGHRGQFHGGYGRGFHDK